VEEVRHFEGDDAAGGVFGGAINDAHAAVADFFFEGEVAEVAGFAGGGAGVGGVGREVVFGGFERGVEQAEGVSVQDRSPDEQDERMA
jgi:hypothetical protein